ncbi:oxidoreductase [Streptomyces sp. NPDC088341]|uniref:oxidoreductase n=1 Tax=Streptomyces sp. NPDC088341 TaxID=3154870 RepID=UPI003432F5F6
MKVWFITGASRGFGLEIARKVLDGGDAVVATARDPRTVHDALPEGGDRLLAVPLDVTVEEQARQAVDAAMERFGRIDVLVNNAGRGLLGAVEEASADEVRAVFETNVFGLLAVTRAVLPVMRRQRAGRVINISSVGGFSAGTGWGVYAGTKFAVEGLSESLRAELLPLGILTTVVEPGVFSTDFLDPSSLHRAGQAIADYAETAGRTRRWAEESNHAQEGDPVKAAEAIVTLAAMADPPSRLQLGADSVERVQAKLDLVAEELTQWRELALSTAHNGGTGF